MMMVMTIISWTQIFSDTDDHRFFLVLNGLYAPLIQASVIGVFQVEVSMTTCSGIPSQGCK
jgi:hypothetical protein